MSEEKTTDEDISNAEHADVEALLGRLPLAAPGSRLDLRVHAALNDVALARAAGVAETVAPSEPIRRPGHLGMWIRQARPVALASAALVALAFGVGLLLPAQKPIGVRPPTHPGPDRVVPQPISREMLEESDLSTQLMLQAAAEASDATGAARSSTPVGLQQTFDRVQDDGVVLVDGKTAYQRLRRQAVRRIVVVDPQTGEHVTVSVPTQELLVRRLEPF